MFGFLIFNAILQMLIAINLHKLQPRLREYALNRLNDNTKLMLPITRLWLRKCMIFTYVIHNVDKIYFCNPIQEYNIHEMQIFVGISPDSIQFLPTYVTINKHVYLFSNSW